jgi:hypothetical protein
MSLRSSRLRHRHLAEREALIRAHLAASRIDLLATQVALKAGDLHRVAPLPVRAFELVKVAPNVMLLTAILVGALTVGPRKIASVIVRNGLVGWIGKNARQLAGR